jgi:type VI secretion system secreted protein Hcp
MSQQAASRRSLLAGTLGGSALGGLVLATPDSADAVTVPSDPGSSFFLAIDAIPGDETDADVPRTIRVLDWSFGAATAISPTNTGAGVGKSKPQPFTFVTRMSSASPKLFLACAKGTHIPTATLTARRVGAVPFVYLELTLKNLFVTSYQAAPHPVDAFPLDVVRLEYGAVRIAVKVQNLDGSARTVTTGFDFIENVVV